MKTNYCSKTILSLLTAIVAVCGVSSARGAVNYHVTVSTASLIGDSAAPFALDFLLTGGNALSNSVTINNFTFGLGGSASSNPAATNFGLASGSLSSTVSLADDVAHFSNELFQGFIPGSSLGFDITLTTNLNGPTPDAFGFTILDRNLQNIPTNGPGNSLLLIDINRAVPSAQAFSSLTKGVTVVVSGGTITPIPEPSTGLFGVVVLGACAANRRRRGN